MTNTTPTPARETVTVPAGQSGQPIQPSARPAPEGVFSGSWAASRRRAVALARRSAKRAGNGSEAAHGASKVGYRSRSSAAFSKSAASLRAVAASSSTSGAYKLMCRSTVPSPYCNRVIPMGRVVVLHRVPKSTARFCFPWPTRGERDNMGVWAGGPRWQRRKSTGHSVEAVGWLSPSSKLLRTDCGRDSKLIGRPWVPARRGFGQPIHAAKTAPPVRGVRWKCRQRPTAAQRQCQRGAHG